MKTTKHFILTALCAAGLGLPAFAQTPASITTPDKVQTRIGTLDFKDGMPSKETIDKVYDNLDFTHAFEAFVNTFQGVNMAAAHKGFLDIGVKRLTRIVPSDHYSPSSGRLAEVRRILKLHLQGQS